MEKYPPYVDATGKIADVFNEIKKASVPAKFTNDFLGTVLGLKSSSYRAMIPLLKRLGFLTVDSVPTQAYKEYRDESLSGQVMAESIKEAYSELYRASEYAHKLKRDDINNKLRTLLGASKADKNVNKVTATFTELVKLAEFDKTRKTKTPTKTEETKEPIEKPLIKQQISEILPTTFDKKFGISYTINLNLPATTEIEVYNSIFKALKENLLNG